MATKTTNFDFWLPALDGDENIWGQLLNENWQKIDYLILSDGIGGAVPPGGVQYEVLMKLGPEDFNVGWDFVDHSQLTGITPDDHHAQEHNLYHEDHPDVIDTGDIQIRDVLAWRVNDDGFQRETRMNWRNVWGAGTYYTHDVVYDQGFLMVANKTTTDRAAPQENDDDTWDMPDVPLWDGPNPSFNGVVESGRVYLAPVPVTLVGYQVWAPVLGPDINYVIRTFSYTQPDASDIVYQEISEPVLNEDDWTTVATLQTLVLPGTYFGILLNVLNSGSDTIVGPFDWGRGADENTANPASGDWNRRTQDDIVRIHKVDDNGIDRGTSGDGSLDGIIAGSTIQIVNQVDALQSVTYTVQVDGVYDGTAYTFGVVRNATGPNGEPPVGTICVITITVPIPQPTEYVKLTAGDPGPNTRGILRLGGVDQPADADAFGVRILLRSWTESPDWDVAVLPGGAGGGGGSGGGGIGDAPNDGQDYVRNSLNWVVANYFSGDYNDLINVPPSAGYWEEGDSANQITPVAGVTQVGIGTSNPGTQLNVDGAGDQTIRVGNNASDGVNSLEARATSTGTARLRLRTNANNWDIEKALTANQLKFRYDSVDMVTINASGRITQAGTTSFTPSSGNFTGISSEGTYTQLGSHIMFSLRISWTGKTGGGSAIVSITGLPFTAASAPARYAVALSGNGYDVPVHTDGGTRSPQVTAAVIGGTSTIQLFINQGGGVEDQALNAGMNTSGTLYISGVYVRN